MKLASISPQNLLILAAVGIAAYWFVTRQARAASSNGATAANKSFFSSPARPYANLQSGSKYPDASGLIGGALSAVNALMGNKRPHYQSAVSEGSAGEGEARLYYEANKDRFAVNPPDSYNTEPTLLAPTDGWLDNQ